VTIAVVLLGTAALPGVFYMVLGATRENFPVAAAVALSGAILSSGAALVIAVLDLRHERTVAIHRRCSEEEKHSHGHAAHG
jgi:hypothetical protein